MSIKKLWRLIGLVGFFTLLVWVGGTLRNSPSTSFDVTRDKPLGVNTSGSSPASPSTVSTSSPSPSTPASPESPSTQALQHLNPSTPLGVDTSVSVPILMYHYIRNNPDPNDTLGDDLSVSPDNFKDQLTYLKSHGFTTVSLDDLVLALTGSRDLPQKPIILTFDDGYDDMYTTAYPLLRDNGMVATSYVVTGFIAKAGYMDERAITELDKSGVVTIGSHTQYHVDLSKQTSKRAATEIIESKKKLEQLLGHTVNHFCYPSGKYTDEVVTAVNGAGYLTATTVDPGNTHTYNDRLTLTRVRIHGNTTIEKFGQLVN